MEIDVLKKRIFTASGSQKADLVLKHAWVLNVFTEELEFADVAVQDGYIVGVGSYSGIHEIELSGKVICPGLIDGHIHLESSMMNPEEFEKVVLPHGTTAVVTDPHEIANVAGLDGIRYMMMKTEPLLLDVFFTLSSCVPSTGLDESGAVLNAEDLKPFYQNKRVLGLAEMMNSYGTISGDREILKKITDAHNAGKVVDGHAPDLCGRELNAYITAGVASDHECTNAKEAIEKIRRGQWIMIRQGTAARNLTALLPLFEDPYYQRCMLATDDKHPGDLIEHGHMDAIIREAIQSGVDPIHAVRMASLHAAQYFHIPDTGAVAPGYHADFIVLDDLKHFRIEQVYKNGILAVDNGTCLIESPKADIPETIKNRIYHSFRMNEVSDKDLQLKYPAVSKKMLYEHVFTLCPHELLTESMDIPYVENEGCAPGVDLKQDIVKLAVFERHHNTGHVGIGFMHGYGLKTGAIASSIAHDSHNLMVAGTNDPDMILAANAVRNQEGGLAIAADGKVLGTLALPVAGLMSPLPANVIEARLKDLKKIASELGIPSSVDAFMTLAFTSLPVIPKLRVNTYGMIDVDHQKVIDTLYLYEKDKVEEKDNL